ncbi:Uncharacterized protein Adt_17064 [Abeliophyllum distichum]|uniref:Uncharacterized protein n=1 Tax=Abeliophyllum distichum TaxID=126358 RepID=A0ABD1TFR2_9LAMI
MSIISSIVLVLLSLLFFSFHGCRARSFGVFNKEPVEGFHSSIKKNEATSLVWVSIQPDTNSSESNRPKATKIKSKNMSPENPVVPHSRKSLHKVQVLGTVQTEPAVSVSWRVPHKKRGEEEPGFNLDYLPPKTHPPSHN